MPIVAEPKQSRARVAATRLSAVLGLALLGAAGAPAAHAGIASVEPEESDVRTITPPTKSWFYVQRGFVAAGTAIYDSATGKYIGQVETPVLGDMAIDPAGKKYYVSQSIWTRRIRGTRQDYVSVYDSQTLKFETDIDFPGRMLVGGRQHNFIIEEDGKTAYVYNFSPVSSVNVLDLAKRKFVRTFELPGCADLILNPGVGLAALCSDGSMASVALKGGKTEITRTDPFFSATGDPIFDNVQYDKAKGEVVMMSYTGLVYTAKLGAKISVSAPFSLQEAAGVRKAETKPLDVAWYPGGGEPIALHRPSGHLFVLMHAGEYWSHKAGASEIWELDVAAKKVVKRLTVTGEPTAIAVTQEATPRVIVAGDDLSQGASEGTVQVIDPATGTVTATIKNAGSGLITVAE